MFGNDENQDQNQHNVPVSIGSMPDPATTAPVGNPLQAPAEASSPITTVSPSTPSAGQDDASSTSVPGSNDLLDIKQQALQHLSPLVGQLEQSPEEKFRTTMMMIQASDDQKLIKDAFEAAKQITDDKARAQALLDVINEINYFTQQQK